MLVFSYGYRVSSWDINGGHMHHRRTFTFILILLVFCTAAFASEKFVISANAGQYLILKIVEVKQNHIKQEDMTVIDTRTNIVNTAVIPRKLSDFEFVFDVYFATCSDIDCANSTLSMIRVDSELQARLRKNFTIPVAYTISTERLQGPRSFTSRLFIGNGGSNSERKIRIDGSPYKNALDVGASEDHYSAIAAEDGRMAASISRRNQIQLWTLHPSGAVKAKQIDDPVYSLALSNVAASLKTGLTRSTPTQN